MCAVCDLADRVCNIIEVSFPEQEILDIVRQAYPNEGIYVDGVRSEKLDLCAFIAYVASHWAIRHNVHPSDFMSMMVNLGAHAYAEATADRAGDIMGALEKQVDEAHGNS